MATRRWLGRAVAIAEVYTVTIANTWATADTATLTINGKDLTLTVGTDASTDNVATAITEMVNGDAQTGTGDHTFSQTGNNIGEFSGITATVSGSVVTLTADTRGVPFTLTATESTGGSGTATAANPTDATGPNHWDNADNWSGDTVPVDGDTVVFDHGDVSCKYALATAIQPASFIVTSAYEGEIGLPKVNEDDSALPYDEYRAEYMQFANDTGTSTLTIEAGEGEGAGSGRIKLDLNDVSDSTVNVRGSGQRAETGIPALLLKGTDADTVLNVMKGDVGVAFYDDESGHLATLRVGYLDDIDGDSTVVCGDGVDLTNATIEITGGDVTIESTTSSGTIEIDGGTLNVLDGAHASIEADGGEVQYRSTGTLTTVKIGGGATLDFRRDNRAKTVTNCELHSGGTLHAPFEYVTITNGVDLYRCGLSEVELNLGRHVTLTPSAV